MHLYSVLWLFFAYSFLGWVLETVMAALNRRQFVNRGVLTGPVCVRYGIFLVFCTRFGHELKESWFFLFIGCAVLGGFWEWLSGRLLEKLYHRKWWDYYARKYQFDGYVSLRSAAVCGVVGTLAVHFVSPVLLRTQLWLPAGVRHILLWCSMAVLWLDILWNLCTILGLPQRLPQAETVHNRLGHLTLRLTHAIVRFTESRLQHSYPILKKAAAKRRTEAGVFAPGCCFSKLFWLFVIGAFLGDITETIFCRVRAGVWMSRSSLVWGPFSIVWGLAIAMATLLLYNYRDRSDGFLFAFGTVLGGVYEYVCSVATEIAFGQVFWDYSALPFNLGGRINLLYCFFWGIAAVVWLKVLFPPISALIEKIPPKAGRPLTVLLVVFMAANITVSSLALYRSSTRAQGQPAQSGIEIWLDAHYSDDVMARIYPNAISVNKS